VVVLVVLLSLPDVPLRIVLEVVLAVVLVVVIVATLFGLWDSVV
jgi:hypothetical protein